MTDTDLIDIDQPAAMRASALRGILAGMRLLTLPQIAAQFGISRQRAHIMIHGGTSKRSTTAPHPDFPAPAGQIGDVPVWFGEEIDTFAGAWDRTPGRRPKPKADPAPVAFSATGELLPWSGTIALEGVWTADDRRIMANATTWPADLSPSGNKLPVNLLNPVDAIEGVSLVGSITEVWRDQSVIHARGLVALPVGRYTVGADLADVEEIIETVDRASLAAVHTTVTRGRLLGVTVHRTSDAAAWPECVITVGEPAVPANADGGPLEMSATYPDAREYR